MDIRKFEDHIRAQATDDTSKAIYKLKAEISTVGDTIQAQAADETASAIENMKAEMRAEMRTVGDVIRAQAAFDASSTMEKMKAEIKAEMPMNHYIREVEDRVRLHTAVDASAMEKMKAEMRAEMRTVGDVIRTQAAVDASSSMEKMKAMTKSEMRAEIKTELKSEMQNELRAEYSHLAGCHEIFFKAMLGRMMEPLLSRMNSTEKKINRLEAATYTPPITPSASAYNTAAPATAALFPESNTASELATVQVGESAQGASRLALHQALATQTSNVAQMGDRLSRVEMAVAGIHGNLDRFAENFDRAMHDMTRNFHDFALSFGKANREHIVGTQSPAPDYRSVAEANPQLQSKETPSPFQKGKRVTHEAKAHTMDLYNMGIQETVASQNTTNESPNAQTPKTKTEQNNPAPEKLETPTKPKPQIPAHPSTTPRPVFGQTSTPGPFRRQASLHLEGSPYGNYVARDARSPFVRLPVNKEFEY